MRVLFSILAIASLALATASSAVVAQGSPYPVRHEVFGEFWPEDQGDDLIVMGRTTIQPGEAMPATRFAGKWFARVDSGVLTIDGVVGPLRSDGMDDDDPLARGGSDDLEAGTWLHFGPDTAMTWSNSGSQPVEILTTAMVDLDDEPMAELDPATLGSDAAVADPFAGEVVKRVVLKGASQGLKGYDYRITVRDRSGQLLGARVPQPRELRFLELWDRVDQAGGIVLGPIAPRTKGTELLVTWTAGVCGPIATIDIGEDVLAMRVTESTTSCDAMGMFQSVVLRLDGVWPWPEDIDASVRRR